MIFWILTILISKVWSIKFIHLNCNVSDTEVRVLDLHLSISNGFVSSKGYDKLEHFEFDIVNFPVLDGGVYQCTSYEVYISQRIMFARVCSHMNDFNARN